MTIVILSSLGRPEGAAEAADLLIARILTKPITQSELFDAIVSALGLARGNVVLVDTIAADRSASFVSRRILLAEDGLVNQKVAVGLLTKRGHQVTVVDNGRAAVEAILQYPFDLVLMDLQMPTMDGFAATAAIRQRELDTGGRIPIIAMTAHAMKEDRQRCLDAGMDGFISKPFRPRELFAAVEHTKPALDAP